MTHVRCIPMGILDKTWRLEVQVNVLANISWQTIGALQLRVGTWYCGASLDLNSLTPVASFTKEVNPRLAKRPLVFNGRLANRRLTSLVKEATVRFECNFRWVNFEGSSSNLWIRYLLWNCHEVIGTVLHDDKSALVQVMAGCHYLNQFWRRSMFAIWHH